MKLLLLLFRCGRNCLGGEGLLQADRLLVEDLLHTTLLLLGTSLGWIHFLIGSLLTPYKKISMTSIFFYFTHTDPRHKESTLHPYQ